MILGEEIKDVDMVVDLPEGGIRFVQWLGDGGLLEGNPQLFPEFGTTKFHLRAFPETELECVNTRKEAYPDFHSRNPVTGFGTLEEDCMRRDLTVNSLYIRVSDSVVVDPCGHGLDDIRGKVIRCTAEPGKSLYEDPLRILRTARFAARLGWDIEPLTLEAMKSLHSRLMILTPARVRGEIEKILLDRDPVRGLSILRESGAIPEIFPEILPDREEDWAGSMGILGSLDHRDPERAWAAFLWQLHDPSRGGAMLERMGYSQKMKGRVVLLLSELRTLRSSGEITHSSVRRLHSRCRSEEAFLSLMALGLAEEKTFPLPDGQGSICRTILSMTGKMKEEGSTLFDYRSPLDGDEVMRLMGLPPGKKVKECMDFLFDLCCENPLRTEEEFISELRKMTFDT